MIDLPSGRQTFDFDCGAKALQLVMAYYGIDIREDELIKNIQCNKDGTSVKKMISFAKTHGFEVIADRGFSVDQIREFVDQNRPVIVLVQAWAERYMTLEDWRNDKDDGHYVIVIGHSGPIMIFEDPGSFRKTWLTEEEFNARWHDVDLETGELLEHFALILMGKLPDTKAFEHMD